MSTYKHKYIPNFTVSSNKECLGEFNREIRYIKMMNQRESEPERFMRLGKYAIPFKGTPQAGLPLLEMAEHCNLSCATGHAMEYISSSEVNGAHFRDSRESAADYGTFSTGNATN